MLFKDKIAKENGSLKTFLPGRYLLTLMGFFACYCGFIYNDLMSLTLDFGTCYNMEYVGQTQSITRTDDCVYSFGLINKIILFIYIVSYLEKLINFNF